MLDTVRAETVLFPSELLVTHCWAVGKCGVCEFTSDPWAGDGPQDRVLLQIHDSCYLCRAAYSQSGQAFPGDFQDQNRRLDLK